MAVTSRVALRGWDRFVDHPASDPDPHGVHRRPHHRRRQVLHTADYCATGRPGLGVPDWRSRHGAWDWAGELAEIPVIWWRKAHAPSIEPGRYTLVIDPTNLWLTIHESIGHATELDRIKGYEANYAGTSFITEATSDRCATGSDLMNITADRTVRHGLSTVAWDDEGVAAQEWNLVTDGVLTDVQLDRSMAAAAGTGAKQRMRIRRLGSSRPHPTNAECEPDAGPAGRVGRRPDRRCRGRHPHRRGQLLVHRHAAVQLPVHRPAFRTNQERTTVGPVKDVAYQGRTTDFWGSLVALGGPDSYLLGGAFNCGKGQPGQVAPVSHGCPPAVFDGVNVLNSAAEGGA